MSAPYYLPELQSAVVGGRRMSWREAGIETEGEAPLMLLHGIGSNSRAWAGQFAGFASTRRVVAWNAPGYAGSDCLSPPWPVATDYGAAILAFLDHLGIGQVVLVGQSLGAIMATGALSLAQERVAALVLASPASGYGIARGQPLPDKVARRIEMLRQLGPVAFAAARADGLLTDHASPQAREIVHKAMGEVVPDGYEQAVHLLAESDLVSAVSAVACPALVMWGGEDGITPPPSCRRVATAIDGADHEEIPGVGHAFATEAPELFNAALGAFLDRAGLNVARGAH